jgi:FMN phosphatase YigB (HAD superfamily)
LFDEKFASYQIGIRKKDPSAFEKILKKLKLKPEEVLLIDNNPEIYLLPNL